MHGPHLPSKPRLRKNQFLLLGPAPPEVARPSPRESQPEPLGHQETTTKRVQILDGVVTVTAYTSIETYQKSFLQLVWPNWLSDLNFFSSLTKINTQKKHFIKSFSTKRYRSSDCCSCHNFSGHHMHEGQNLRDETHGTNCQILWAGHNYKGSNCHIKWFTYFLSWTKRFRRRTTSLSTLGTNVTGLEHLTDEVSCH